MKRVLKWIGIGLGVIIGLILLLQIVSYFLVSEVEQAAFFEPRAGENHPLVFSHQGGEEIRPTNTMIAFSDTAELGSDVLDADMHMTSDGVLVLAHDETVDRTSDGTGEIRGMTLAELRELDFGYRFSTDGDQTFPYRGQDHGIVTLDELFQAFPDIRFGIEIKQTTTEAAVKFCQAIHDFGYTDQVLVSSFAQENMNTFRDECPDVTTSATVGEAGRFYIFQLLGLNGLYSPSFEALQVPEETNGVQVLTNNFVGNARKRGLKIIPWTINTVEDFERLINDFDVDGINTNRPDLLVEFLR